MALIPGTRVGVYEVLAQIGEGGMGQVYRATDTTLGRQVAIKILPDAFAADPERLARFEREAKTLAALNHPHIAAIYGFEKAAPSSHSTGSGQSGMHALVMELVEGDDLSALIARGPLPLNDALPIARQIAEALEAAHEQGIIHRDLKPANIKVRGDGTVKVLDFGLAKAMESAALRPGSGQAGGHEPGAGALDHSPTITTPAMTMRGVILGTAAYMSPEQAKGKVVDKRTDIWAFGCVLYEMLAGRRAFEGEDVSDTLAAILRGEPDWTLLHALPPAIHTLLRRSLERDWRRRIASMSTVRFVLDDPAVLSPASPVAAQVAAGEVQARVDAAVAQARRHVFARRVMPLVALAAIAMAAAVVGFSRPGAPLPPAPVVRFLLGLPEGQVLGFALRTMTLSPNGKELAYLTDSQLLIRRLSEFEMVPVTAADLGRNLQSPVFSPDGEWIAYYAAAERVVKRISVRGGAALRVCESLPALTLDWDASGILVAQGAGGVVRCNPAGGAPEQLVKVADGEAALGPQILPGGDTLLLTIAQVADGPGTRWDQALVVVQSLRTGERKTVLKGGSNARLLGTGHLIYSVGGIVFAARFDLDTRELRGEAVPVVEGVRRSPGGALQLDISDSGTLVYLPGPTGTSQGLRGLAIGDRAGNITAVPVSPAAYSHVRVSRDGTRAAIGVDDLKEASVVIYALNGTSAVQRLTLEGRNRFPVWSPDGQWIAFQSDRAGDLGIFRQRADGTGAAERLTTAAAGEEHVPESWSPDGRHLSFAVRKPSTGRPGYTLWVLAVADKKASPFGGADSVDPIGSVFSPDGKWLAYGKGTGAAVTDPNRGVFLQPFPATGAVYQVPRQLVDFHPAWPPSGGELVFTVAASAGQMATVRVATAGGVTFGTPVRFPASVGGDRLSSEPRAWDLLPDGRLIGIISATEGATRSSPSEMRLVLNWFEDLKQRVPMQ